MRLESRAVWHVNDARRNVIDGGEIVVAKRGKIWPVTKKAAIRSQRRKRDSPWKQVRKLLQQRAIVRLSRDRAALQFEVRLNRARSGKGKGNGNRSDR